MKHHVIAKNKTAVLTNNTSDQSYPHSHTLLSYDLVVNSVDRLLESN